MSAQLPLFDAVECDIVDLLEHMGDELPEREQWPERLHELWTVTVAALRRREPDLQRCELLARDVVIAIGDYLGGRNWIIPRGDALRTALRDAEIYRVSRRGNAQQLATDLGLHITQLHRIIRQQHRLHQRKMQGRLFGDEGLPPLAPSGAVSRARPGTKSNGTP